MDDKKIELGQPGPFAAGVLAGIKASDAIDVPGDTTFDQRAAFFWLHVGTSMASAGLVDAESQALFVEGAKTRAPSREGEPETSDEPNWWEVSYRIGEESHSVEVIADNEEEALYHAPLSVNRTDAVDFRSMGPVPATDGQAPDQRAAVRAAGARVPAVRIWLHRAEGLHAECTEHTFEGPDVWRQARHQLDKWSYTAPDDGTIDKTDFKVTYANGEEYSGTFGLQRYDVDLPAHMRGHLQHLLAHPEVYAKFVDEARTFLDQYEIGPNV